jgi:hypothetical protein
MPEPLSPKSDYTDTSHRSTKLDRPFEKGLIKGRDVKDISIKEKLCKVFTIAAVALAAIAVTTFTIASYIFPPAGLAWTACILACAASLFGSALSTTNAISKNKELKPLQALLQTEKSTTENNKPFSFDTSNIEHTQPDDDPKDDREYSSFDTFNIEQSSPNYQRLPSIFYDDPKDDSEYSSFFDTSTIEQPSPNHHRLPSFVL